MTQYILTIGLFDRDDLEQHISTADALDMIQEILIGRFGVCAATLSTCYGVYRMESGEIVREPSIRAEIATDVDISETIQAVTQYLKWTLNQESIMVETRNTNINFT